MNRIMVEEKMNTVINKHKCTLCGACLNVCPSNAISLQEDEQGFAYPVIDSSKCTNCGLCTKKCPALNHDKTKKIVKKLTEPVCYGGFINDDEIREKSSSGGVFTILSNYVLDKKGYVCGAKFLKGGTVEHVIVDNKEDLEALRGSKYVQSYVNDCYKQIKELLKQDKYVLFTGTPCQVAGLYQVLGKDYDKLITVDLLCHGCPSQKIFKQHLNEATNGNVENIENVRFRYKKNGWRNFWMTIKCNQEEIKTLALDNKYFSGFEKNILIRKSCTDCYFNRLPRQGDFTMGDFWGIEHHNKKLDDNKGTSAILLNTNKAIAVMKETKEQYKKIKKVPIDSIRNFNMVEWKSYTHPFREYFFDKYSKGEYNSLAELIDETVSKNDGIALLNYHYAKDNYGSVLTAYGLQQKIKSLGYTPANIIFYDAEKVNDMSNLGDFTKKYISETAPCWTLKDLRALNNKFSTFIVGPDAVWKDLGFMPNFYYNLFNFARFSKNICSYAASFANDKLISFKKGAKEAINVTPEEIKHRKMLYKRFSHISVREKSGVKLCKEHFDVEAVHVLDSVFFLNSNEWLKIVADGKDIAQLDNKYVSYILNHKTLPEGCTEVLEKMDIKKLYNGDNYMDNFTSKKGFKYKGETIENWINSIANCECFITDSYHGMCFAIIFNKPFILFNASPMTGYERHKSLMEMLEIQDRTAYSKEDIERLLNTPIDYDKVNQKLQEHLKTSEDFLKKILADNNKPNEIRSYMESLEIRMEIAEGGGSSRKENQGEVLYFRHPSYEKKDCSR